MENYVFDENYGKNKYLIAGIDEAGRGPLAGPVTAAAVILDFNNKIPGLNDSKKITEKKRLELYKLIKNNALSYAISFISNGKIDEINIYQASRLAMYNALIKLQPLPNVVLTDAMPMLCGNMEIHPIKKGDTLSASIMAASILAKVERDELMKIFDEIYPGYNFKKHKGYPTKAHREAIKRLGPCEIHRNSFTLLKSE